MKSAHRIILQIVLKYNRERGPIHRDKLLEFLWNEGLSETEARKGIKYLQDIEYLKRTRKRGPNIRITDKGSEALEKDKRIEDVKHSLRLGEDKEYVLGTPVTPVTSEPIFFIDKIISKHDELVQDVQNSVLDLETIIKEQRIIPPQGFEYFEERFNELVELDRQILNVVKGIRKIQDEDLMHICESIKPSFWDKIKDFITVGDFASFIKKIFEELWKRAGT